MRKKLAAALGAGLLVGLMAVGTASAQYALHDGQGSMARYGYSWQESSGQGSGPLGDQDQTRLRQQDQVHQDQAAASETPVQARDRTRDCTATPTGDQTQTRSQTQSQTQQTQQQSQQQTQQQSGSQVRNRGGH